MWAVAFLLSSSVFAQGTEKDSDKKESTKTATKTINYCSGFLTYTQEHWGEKSEGTSGPGYIRNSNFARVFPTGLTIGCIAGYKITFTTSAALQTFLPAEGNSYVLNKSTTNPKNSNGGGAIGELIALTLNVAMDDNVASFATPSNHLGDMIINYPSLPFNGMSVRAFLQLGNNVVGGCTSGYSATNVAKMAQRINENFKKGVEQDEENDKKNNGILLCTPPLVINTSGVNILCSGSTGSANVVISGGVAPFTITWSNAATTASISGLSAATYTVTVKDAASQSSTASITITSPAALVSSLTPIHVLCYGNSTGAINSSVTGGVTPYSYLWSSAQTSANLSSLSAGSFELTVTDANGCTSKTNATITQPASALNQTSASRNVTCYGLNNGSIDLSITGGTMPYSYNWSDNSTSEDRNSLAPNTYNVTITDNNNCTLQNSFTITEPTELKTSTSSQNVLCKDGNTGSINLSVSGGTSAYSYSWLPNNASTEDLTTLTANTYSYTVTDQNNCTSSGEVVITEPTKLSIEGTITPISCYKFTNGAINASVTGGTASYTYSWTGGAPTEDISNLNVGEYTLEVTDANGCTANKLFSLTQPDSLYTNADVVNVLCHGNNTGSILLAPIGGTTPYQYSYLSDLNNKGNRLSNLLAGTYAISITDNNGCVYSSSYEVTEPTAIVVSSTLTHVSCNNGTNGAISTTINGGVGNKTISWSPISSTNTSLSALKAGTYTYTVTDQNNCVKTQDLNITQPDVLAVSISSNLQCFKGNNGALTATVTGGTPSYTYAWTKNSSATLSTLATISGRGVGTFNVAIIDNKGCSTNKSITINPPSTSGFGTYFTNDKEHWGSTYLNNNFAAAFPNGLTIGSGNNKITFTTGAAVYSFLNNSSNGTNATLPTGNLMNPSAINNGLAIEALVLSLNIGFDAYYPAFAPATGKLGDLVVYEGENNSLFEGLTLSEFLSICNTALAGTNTTFALTAVRNTAQHMNVNFHENENEHLIASSCIVYKNNEANGPVENMSGIANSVLNTYPNPFSNQLTISFSTADANGASLELYSAEGVLIERVFNGSVKEKSSYSFILNTELLPSGSYFCRFVSSNETLVNKLMLVK